MLEKKNAVGTVVQSLWIGDRLSDLERLSIRSFLCHGHTYHLYVYREMKDVPAGTILKDAGAIIPESEIFTYANGSYAAFADWFRYRLMRETGHFWVDTDIVCLKPLYFEASRVFALQEPGVVNNAVLRFPAKDPVIRTLEKQCRRPNALMLFDSLRRMRRKLARRYLEGNDRGNIEWGEYGPKGLTLLLARYGLVPQALPAETFYPVPWTAWRSIFDGTIRGDLDALNGSYCIHLWNEMLRRNQIDKNARFPRHSLIESLRDRYLC